jgi:hypothetical protein
MRLDPELTAVVKRARRHAEDAGDLKRGPFPPFTSNIPPVAADALVEWLRDGGYEAAVARVTREDPDLANQ